MRLIYTIKKVYCVFAKLHTDVSTFYILLLEILILQKYFLNVSISQNIINRKEHLGAKKKKKSKQQKQSNVNTKIKQTNKQTTHHRTTKQTQTHPVNHSNIKAVKDCFHANNGSRSSISNITREKRPTKAIKQGFQQTLSLVTISQQRNGSTDNKLIT